MSHTDDNNRTLVELLVDVNTGEITGGIYEGDTIISGDPEQDEYKRNHILKFRNKEEFVKTYTGGWFELYHELAMKEAQILLGIIPLISYSDGVLRYNKQIVDIKTISELLRENYDVTRKAIKGLINKGVLAKTDIVSDKTMYKTQKCYVVNPYIFFKGVDAERKYVDLFSNTRWYKE